MAGTLKILQVACYRGNIGDNANVVGTRAILRRTLGPALTFTDLDILDFLWGDRQYDDTFVALANRHDLVLIGGGGFFELTRDDTCSGTALNLSPETVRQIRVPVVFHALGMDVPPGVPVARVQRFQAYVEALLALPHVVIAVRNDGAHAALREWCGDAIADQIPEVPDGGFFTEAKSGEHPELPRQGRILAVNLAGDMLGIRFPGAARVAATGWRRMRGAPPSVTPDGLLDELQFIRSFSATLAALLSEHDDLHLCLVPHTYMDVAFGGRVLEELGSKLARRRATQAPYLQGEGAQDYVMEVYRRSDLVLGMRFHANVCPIGLGVPSLGLGCYPQIEALYHRLDMEARCIPVNRAGFRPLLKEAVTHSLANADRIRAQYRQLRTTLVQQLETFHRSLVPLLTGVLEQ